MLRKWSAEGLKRQEQAVPELRAGSEPGPNLLPGPDLESVPELEPEKASELEHGPGPGPALTYPLFELAKVQGWDATRASKRVPRRCVNEARLLGLPHAVQRQELLVQMAQMVIP